VEQMLYIQSHKCHLGIPVATVAIDGAKNAAILASLIIGVQNDEIYNKVCDFKESLKTSVSKKDAKLQELGYEEYLKQM
jgi:5-(carboxyamino)imidazole ribonucleotide mutase